MCLRCLYSCSWSLEHQLINSLEHTILLRSLWQVIFIPRCLCKDAARDACLVSRRCEYYVTIRTDSALSWRNSQRFLECINQWRAKVRALDSLDWFSTRNTAYTQLRTMTLHAMRTVQTGTYHYSHLCWMINDDIIECTYWFIIIYMHIVVHTCL